jgi:hypothetical protein
MIELQYKIRRVACKATLLIELENIIEQISLCRMQ